MTYRVRAHSEGMRESGYRTPDEVTAWKARCPITSFKERLVHETLATEAEIQALEAGVRALVEEATALAEQSPLPDPATGTHHLYSQEEPQHA